MNELTPQEKLTIATYDRQAESWSTAHAQGDFWSEETARFKELLPSGRILEIGAGGGRDAKELIAAGYDYLGTDVSTGLLEQARTNNPGATFEQVSVYDLDYQKPFDGFWCAAVLLHIPRDRIDAALTGIHKNMRQGAIGFIAIKEGEGEQLESDDASTNGNQRLFVYWNGSDFSDKLGDNGLRVIEQGYQPINDRTKWLTYFVEVNDTSLV